MLNKIQITLTVNAGKWLIAKAITERKDVKEGFKKGRVLFMGGTTVSAASELLTGKPLRISGRILPRGTSTAKKKTKDPHTLLSYKGKYYNIEEDEESIEILNKLGRGDVVITGANAVDAQGNAALMAGAYGFGSRRNLLAPIHTEGANLVVAAGLEKLIHGTINEAINSTGRDVPIWSMGASVGLVPINGEIVNELKAIESLTKTKAIVIGSGGIRGAEGSSTLIVEGAKVDLEKLLSLVKWASDQPISGIAESLKECQHGTEKCKRHKTCCYKSGKLFENL